MRRAQGALEYLIIIAAVLGIAALVVFLSASLSSSGTSNASFNACREAASQCKATHYAVPMDPCEICKAGCNSSGKEVFSGALVCCKAGRPEMIYAGSTGCS